MLWRLRNQHRRSERKIGTKLFDQLGIRPEYQFFVDRIGMRPLSIEFPESSENNRLRKNAGRKNADHKQQMGNPVHGDLSYSLSSKRVAKSLFTCVIVGPKLSTISKSS